ncbi:MAG: methyltransferase domain-containing protein [Chitinophagales bacterium]|nr:methyltransferase domain-containing protein [Chitinophagales bacterium]
MNFNRFKKKIKTKLLARLLAGGNVTCNVCGSSYSSFLPYLDRPNALCPQCGSLERTRLIWHFIEQLQLITNNTKLLHIAPEKCLYDIFSKKLGKNYIPADKFEEVYTYPKGTVHMDITDINMEDETVDAIICIHVLEHIKDDQKAIAELYRVLKKGGFAILQVPYEKGRATTYEDPSITSQEERRKHFGQFDHVRIYGTDFMDRFTDPGFKVEHRNYADTLTSAIKDRHVFKQQEIFLLRK